MKLLSDLDHELRIADQKGRIALGRKYAGKRFIMREKPDGSAVLTPVMIVPEGDESLSGTSIDEAFATVGSLHENWDGHASLAPSEDVVRSARETYALLKAAALAGNAPWIEPHIGSNERGQIMLEWWNGLRTLTLFVRSSAQIDYLKSWGSNIESEMEDGVVEKILDFVQLSHWLYNADLRAA